MSPDDSRRRTGLGSPSPLRVLGKAARDVIRAAAGTRRMIRRQTVCVACEGVRAFKLEAGKN